MDERDELRRRCQAIRLWLKDTPPKVILQRVQRSRARFGKWRARFRRAGQRALRSRSRRPHPTPVHPRRFG